MIDSETHERVRWYVEEMGPGAQGEERATGSEASTRRTGTVWRERGSIISMAPVDAKTKTARAAERRILSGLVAPSEAAEVECFTPRMKEGRSMSS